MDGHHVRMYAYHEGYVCMLTSSVRGELWRTVLDTLFLSSASRISWSAFTFFPYQPEVFITLGAFREMYVHQNFSEQWFSFCWGSVYVGFVEFTDTIDERLYWTLTMRRDSLFPFSVHHNLNILLYPNLKFIN